MLFYQQTQKTHSYCHWVIAELLFILTRIGCLHQTRPRKGVQHVIVRYHTPHTHSLPSLSWCRSLCQKWELFFVDPQVKSQWTVLVGYLTISTNVNYYQTRCQWQYYFPFSNTAHACTIA